MYATEEFHTFFFFSFTLVLTIVVQSGIRKVFKMLKLNRLFFLAVNSSRSFRFSVESKYQRSLSTGTYSGSIFTSRCSFSYTPFFREKLDEISKSTANSITNDGVVVTNSMNEVVSIQPLRLFSDLVGAPHWLKHGLKESGFPETTPIQKYTIPVLEEGHDVIGLAPTGSGKTVAFAVPALKNYKNTTNSPSILVLAPTRELVQQTTIVFQKLSRGEVRVCEAYGGSPRELQARKLGNGCDVLVACPGRLNDFLKQGEVSLNNLSFLVFDEADRLLDMGFQIQLDEILSHLDPSISVQKMMWSATWPTSVQRLAKTYLSSNRYVVRAGAAGTGLQVNRNISQTMEFANSVEDRIAFIAKLIETGKIDENTAKVIIFVERKADTENVAYSLSQKLGIHSRFVGVLHGGLHQRQRDNVMNQFKRSDIRLLVATDVASRGLDIPDVTCVINFDVPGSIDSYCHRIGRTGRAGRKGDAFTFISEESCPIAPELVDYLQKADVDVPGRLIEVSKKEATRRLYRRDGDRRRGGRNRNGGFRSCNTDNNRRDTSFDQSLYESW